MTERNNLIRIPGIFRVRLVSGDWTNSYSAFSGGQKIVISFLFHTINQFLGIATIFYLS